MSRRNGERRGLTNSNPTSLSVRRKVIYSSLGKRSSNGDTSKNRSTNASRHGKPLANPRSYADRDGFSSPSYSSDFDLPSDDYHPLKPLDDKESKHIPKKNNTPSSPTDFFKRQRTSSSFKSDIEASKNTIKDLFSPSKSHISPVVRLNDAPVFPKLSKNESTKGVEPNLPNLAKAEDFDLTTPSIQAPAIATFANKKVKKQLSKADYTEEEWESISKGEKAAKEAKKITKELEIDDDPFRSKLKKPQFFDPSVLKAMATKNAALDDLDSDEEIKADINNNHNVSFNETRSFEKNLKATKLKYRDITYPGSLKKDALTRKVNRQFQFIEDLIKNEKSLNTSRFYKKAKEISVNSTRSTLSLSEFLKLPIAKSFSVGFYGLKRHSSIAHLIRTKFEHELNKLASANTVVQFWSVDSFVTYILACEAAVRIAAKDMRIPLDEAYDILESTADYGKYITDEDTMYDSDDESDN